MLGLLQEGNSMTSLNFDVECFDEFVEANKRVDVDDLQDAWDEYTSSHQEDAYTDYCNQEVEAMRYE